MKDPKCLQIYTGLTPNFVQILTSINKSLLLNSESEKKWLWWNISEIEIRIATRFNRSVLIFINHWK